MSKNNYVFYLIIIGLVFYLILFYFIFSKLDIYFGLPHSYDSFYFLIIANIILFLLFQIPSILFYYAYKLKIIVLSGLREYFNEGDLIEIELKITDSSNFIFVDVNLKVDWPGEIIEIDKRVDSIVITLSTENLIGENNLCIKASKKGFFSSTLTKDLIIL